MKVGETYYDEAGRKFKCIAKMEGQTDFPFIVEGRAITSGKPFVQRCHKEGKMLDQGRLVIPVTETYEEFLR